MNRDEHEVTTFDYGAKFRKSGHREITDYLLYNNDNGGENTEKWWLGLMRGYRASGLGWVEKGERVFFNVILFLMLFYFILFYDFKYFFFKI